MSPSDAAAGKIWASFLNQVFSRGFTTTLLVSGALILGAAIWRSQYVASAWILALAQAVTFLGCVLLLVLRLGGVLTLRQVAAGVLAFVGIAASAGAVVLGIVGVGFEVLLLWAIIASFLFGREGGLSTFAVLAMMLPLSAFIHHQGYLPISSDHDMSSARLAYKVITVLIFAASGSYLVVRLRDELLRSFEAELDGERKARVLQRALEESRKRLALESLAAGLAHDFGNTMVLARAYANQLADEPAGPRARELRGHLSEAISQAIEMVESLRGYGVPEESPAGEFADLALVMRQFAGMSGDGGYATVVDCAAGQCVVRASFSQLYRIVLNLHSNAAAALDGSAGDTIWLRARVLDEASGLDRWVELTVEDNGRGIPPELIDSIFDPYVTGHQPTNGLAHGLGLAIVRSIVQRVGGQVRVESELDARTRFIVFLPACAEPDLRTLRTPSDDAKEAGHHRILVVEDSEEVAQWICAALARGGLACEAFQDPRQALESAFASPDEYSLAIVDRMLPHLDGETFVGELRALRADLPVIWFSGTCTDRQTAGGEVASSPFTLSLQKPCSGRTLVASVRQALVAGNVGIRSTVSSTRASVPPAQRDTIGSTEACVASEIANVEPARAKGGDWLKTTSALVAQLERALQLAHAGTWRWDPDARDVVLDERSRSLLRLPPSAAVHATDLLFLLEDSIRASTLETVQKRIDETGEFDVQFPGKRYDGTLASWRILGGRSEDECSAGASSGLIVEVGGGTQLRKLERELLTVLGHELKTPLTSIRGFVELLRGNDLRPETRDRYYLIICREVLRISQLAHNFTQLSQIEAERDSLAAGATDLREVLEKANQSAWNLMGREDRVQMEFQANLPHVGGNPLLIHSVFTNILVNAYKFSSPSSKIEVQARSFRSAVRVEVSNRGHGVLPDELPRVFDRFFSGSNTGHAGAGIGLAVAKGLLLEIGGAIDMASEIDGDTTVTVTLPASPS